MITNADITIYNKVLNEETRMDIWKRTVIKGVSFYSDTKVTMDNHGLVTADVYKIRIPEECCAGYVPANKYTAVKGTWTLQNDDYIVKGVSPQEITRPAELENGIRIVSWSDNRRGLLPHLRIGGQ